MLPNKPSPVHLAVSMAEERAAWQTLLGQLDAEEQALIAGDPEHLPQLGVAKLAQMNVLGNLARTRLDTLASAGLPSSRVGMDAWLARQPPALHTEWQRLCQLEADAQAANKRIGILIDMRLTATRQALNVLVHAATRHGGLYDQAGQAVAVRSGNPLTAA
jgi:flagella synthesis protein FlgN